MPLYQVTWFRRLVIQAGLQFKILVARMRRPRPAHYTVMKEILSHQRLWTDSHAMGHELTTCLELLINAVTKFSYCWSSFAIRFPIGQVDFFNLVLWICLLKLIQSTWHVSSTEYMAVLISPVFQMFLLWKSIHLNWQRCFPDRRSKWTANPKCTGQGVTKWMPVPSPTQYTLPEC